MARGSFICLVRAVCQRAAWGDFEDRATAVGSATLRCAVQFPVGGLDQPRVGELAVAAIEDVQRGEGLRW